MNLKGISRSLQAGDSILCCFLFFPCMLCFWRGIWDLTGFYLNPDNTVEGDWLIFGVGCCSIVGYFTHPLLDKYLPRSNKILYVVVTRVYMYLHAILYMSYWRGVWELGEKYISEDRQVNLVLFVTFLLILLLLRSFRSALFPPFCVVLDTRDDLLEPAPRFGSKVRL